MAAGRSPGEIRLIAVSKSFSAQAICEAISAGQSAFGESYLQEALEKIAALDAIPGQLNAGRAGGRTHTSTRPASNRKACQEPRAHGPENASFEKDAAVAAEAKPQFSVRTQHCAGVASPQAGPLLRPLEWHFIGPIQSNKTRLIAENFSWVHSVDRLKIAQRLSEARPADLAPLNICLQVNISAEASKSGAREEDAMHLAIELAKLPRLRLRGLMAVPEPTQDRYLQRRRFAAVRALWERIVAQGLNLDSLSMGMSDDLESAIAEGATLVRVGSAIFGERVVQTRG